MKDKEKIKQYQKEYQEKNKEKIKELRKKRYNENKEVEKEKSRKYYHDNKERLIPKNKTKKKLNKEKIKIQRKNYEELNKEKRSQEKREYHRTHKNERNENHKKRLKSDSFYRLKCKYKQSLHHILKSKGLSKNNSTIEILGCSYEDFKEYLESKFKPWMNWDNKGLYNGTEGYGWDIDHIKPLSSAKTEEELLKLCHFSNLQPLCSYINRRIKKDNF